MPADYSIEGALRQLWIWLTRNGTIDPATGGARVSEYSQEEAYRELWNWLTVRGTVDPATLGGPSMSAELGYGENTADFSTASTTGADITNATTGAITIAGNVLISASALVYNTNALQTTVLVVMEDGVNIGQRSFTSGVAAQFGAIPITIRRTPTAGPHTYKLQLYVTANTGHAYGLTPYTPTWIRVTQR